LICYKCGKGARKHGGWFTSQREDFVRRSIYEADSKRKKVVGTRRAQLEARERQWSRIYISDGRQTRAGYIGTSTCWSRRKNSAWAKRVQMEGRQGQSKKI